MLGSCVRFSHLLSSRSPLRDFALEGLRGLSAYAVRYAPVHQFWWFDLGLPSVLIFPVLSGYVIGLTTTGPAKAPHVRTYLSRHFRRLVPLNTAAVILTFAGSPLTFAVRLLLHVALTSVVTWWLERRFVPGLRNHFPPRAPLG